MANLFCFRKLVFTVRIMINLDYKSKKEIAFNTLKLSHPRDGIEIMIGDDESTLPVVGIFLLKQHASNDPNIVFHTVFPSNFHRKGH